MEKTGREGITWKLSLMQAAYWAAGCCTQSFAMVYFLSIGFKNSEAGIFVASGNILGVLLQPYVTKLEFRALSGNFQRSGLFTAGITCLCMLSAFVLKGRLPFLTVFYRRCSMYPTRASSTLSRCAIKNAAAG